MAQGALSHSLSLSFALLLALVCSLSLSLSSTGGGEERRELQAKVLGAIDGDGVHRNQPRARHALCQ